MLYLLVICVSVAIVSSGCINSIEEPPRGTDMSEIVIVQTDQGKIFEASQGDLILIRLAENPSTGYRWGVDVVDNQTVVLQTSDYLATEELRAGSGGTRTFTFKAQSPGTVSIRLTLKRKWESEDATIDRFEVTIVVQRE